MMTTSQERVEKEIIPQLHCLNREVLTNDEKIKQRKELLHRAMVLGNAFHTNARIVFQTREGQKEVTTTIWAVTDRNTILKGGIAIPVCCISDVLMNA